MPVTLFCSVPVAPPVNPPVTVGSNQLYCVPAGTDPIALALNVSPLHTILNWSTGLIFGCTITLTSKLAPTQFPAVGVTVYTTVWSLDEVLTNCWLILFAGVGLSDAPVTLGFCTTVQVYVVPEGTITEPLFCGLAIKKPPLHVVANWLLITGIGCTVIVTTNGAPTQFPLVGTTSYSIVWAVFVAFSKVWEILFWAVATLDCPVKELLLVFIVQV